MKSLYLEGSNDAHPNFIINIAVHTIPLVILILFFMGIVKKRKIFEFSTTIICKSLNKNEKICTKSNESRVRDLAP